MKLESIETEAENCRKAFEGFPSEGFTLHCHHEAWGEFLTEPAENRIAYILRNKPEREQALRLRLFRPIPKSQLKSCKSYAAYYKACAEYDKARAEWHKACAEYDKAYAEYNKASDEWDKARAEYDKARAEWHKACADWHKDNAKFSKEVHDKFCVKGCPWNGRTIFPASTGGTPR